MTCLYCSTNNDAITTLKLFIKAGQQYGFPSRVRSDFGGENIDVARFMILLRGANRGSHLTGRSVHNQRIKRLWHDVFSQCLSLYYHLFYYNIMESSGILDCENALHLCALHYVFFARINNSLEAFQQAWNSHSLRTAAGLTPMQLWVIGMLQNYHSSHLPVQEVFSTSSPESTTPIGEFEGSQSSQEPDIEIHVHPDVLQSLEPRVNPMQPSSTWGIDLYVTALQFLLEDTVAAGD